MVLTPSYNFRLSSYVLVSVLRSYLEYMRIFGGYLPVRALQLYIWVISFIFYAIVNVIYRSSVKIERYNYIIGYTYKWVIYKGSCNNINQTTATLHATKYILQRNLYQKWCHIKLTKFEKVLTSWSCVNICKSDLDIHWYHSCAI